ncbi:MAG TPA: GtrA family protein [Mycobacteriales bacterium]|nr:GtrA family protein [Mycobacteriales bacterium]
MAVARLKHLYATFETLIHELAKFGIVGAFNYVVDVGLFNLLLTQGLHHKPLTAKAISTVVAATSSYFMNRHWTWRDRARRGLVREYGTFILLSAIALVITLGCLAFGEYVLHQHSLLARNIWGNVVGVATAMIWRFWSFKRWVFLEQEPDRSDDALHAALL